MLKFEKLSRQYVMSPSTPNHESREKTLMTRNAVLDIIKQYREGNDVGFNDVAKFAYALDIEFIESVAKAKESKAFVSKIKQAISSGNTMMSVKNRDGILQKIATELNEAKDNAVEDLSGMGSTLSIEKRFLYSQAKSAKVAVGEKVQDLITVIYNSKAVRKFLTDMAELSSESAKKAGDVVEEHIKEDNVMRNSRESNSSSNSSGEARNAEAGPKPATKHQESGTAGAESRMRKKFTDIIEKSKEGKMDASDVIEKGKDIVNNELKETSKTMLMGIYEYLINITNKIYHGQITLAEARAQTLEIVFNKMLALQDQATKTGASIQRTLAEVIDNFMTDDNGAYMDCFYQLMIDLENEPNVRDAIVSLFNIIQDFKNIAVEHANKLKNAVVQDATVDEDGVITGNITDAFDDLQKLVERFASGYSLNTFVNIISRLIDEFKRDRLYSQVWDEFKRLLAWSSDQDITKSKDEFNWRAKNILARVRRITNKKAVEICAELGTELKKIWSHIRHDKYTEPFVNNIESLLKDMVIVDSHGNLNTRSGLASFFSDIASSGVGILDACEFIPIPRLEYTSKSLGLKIDNLLIPIKKCLPEYMNVCFSGEIYPRAIACPKDHSQDFSQYNHGAEQLVDINLKSIRMEAHDIAFYINKTSGFFKIEDSGLANIVSVNRGVDIQIRLRKLHSDEQKYITCHYKRRNSGVFGNRTFPWVCTIVPRERTRRFSIEDIKVDVHDLSISVSRTKHNWIYNFVMWLFKGNVKRQVSEGLKDSLEKGINFLDEEFSEQLTRLEENAKKSIESTSQQIQSAYSSAATAAAAAVTGGSAPTSSIDNLIGNILTPSSSMLFLGGVKDKTKNILSKSANIANTTTDSFKNSISENDGSSLVGEVQNQLSPRNNDNDNTNGGSNVNSNESISKTIDAAYENVIKTAQSVRKDSLLDEVS
ncbi:hypothetical protein H4219_003727 [Mycoemilia scoparia]|uniref:Uncharacterized protein n=1 Tax=Mycoemilia scoparia TaxID=417184 RepID=A0A9W8A1Z9_9FUNG|nr:hypothetical protein H4219_003727 [Mycoemilia scoparia]